MSAPADQLGQGWHERIFVDEVVPKSGLGQAISQERPKAIVLGGQPGAGKGGLADAARIELANDVVMIDPDELREYHPGANEFRNANPYTWSGRTHADAAGWADELRDAVVAGRKNFVFDTTLSNGGWASELIHDLQAKGYEVEVRVVAAHKLESELGVDQRFTNKLDELGHGRYVPAGARDAIHDRLPGSLDMIRERTDVPIRIFSREGVELYDSRTDARLPGAALEEAREARLRDPKLTRSLSQGWQDQQAWHRELPEALPRNHNVTPDTAQRLLTERSTLHVVDGVASSTRQVTHIDFTARVRPNAIRAVGVAGVAVTAYDAADTALDAARLRGQGNDTAAQARIERFAVQNVAGWSGAAAGVGGGALAGVKTGPGLLVTGALGGVIGAVAGDKVADWWDERKIFRQQGPLGQVWTADPDHPQKGWTVTIPPLPGAPRGRTLTADAALSDRLDFQASATAIELALGKPPRNRDPYRLPVDATDVGQAGPFELQRTWERVPATGVWRQAIDQSIDRIPLTRYEPASAQRAEQLEQQSQSVIAQNATQTPAAMAARFKATYERSGWAQYGPLPDPVTEALRNPGRIVGSDGVMYERNPLGQWMDDGLLWNSPAKGNLPDELEATYRRQQADARIPTLEPVRVTAPPVSEGPTAAHDPNMARFLEALGTGDEQGMRESSIAFAESARGRQIEIDAEQRAWDRQQRLPGRDHRLFTDALGALERMGPEAGGYLDRLQMEGMAGALASQARKYQMPAIDEVVPSQDGKHLMATWKHPRHAALDCYCTVDRIQAGTRPLGQSLEELAAEARRQEAQATRDRSPAPQELGLS
ncbi:zeta toxin family protein [Pseudoxanthomonas koreensis]|uniref:zeta toxin family protein n=1 Tax=Pseudoxanthomonas koreensis TaxID=266061 RepID=UPI0035A690A2